MKKKIFALGFIAVLLACSASSWAGLTEAVATTTEGAVEFPIGLVKLVGGVVWTVGEVIILPFRALSGSL